MMSWWNNLSLRPKLIGGFCVALAIYTIALAVTLVAVRSVADVNNELSALTRARATMRDAEMQVRTAYGYAAGLVLKDQSRVTGHGRMHAGFNAAVAALTADQSKIAMFKGTSIEQEAVAAFNLAVDGPTGLISTLRDAMAFKTAANDAQAHAAILKADPEVSEVANSAFRSAIEAQIKDQTALVETMQVRAYAFGIGLGLGATLVGLLIALAVARSVASRVGATTAVLSRVVDEDFQNLSRAFDALAEGRLTATFSSSLPQLDVRGGDEVARLGRSYNDLAVRLRGISSNFTESMHRLRELIVQVTGSTVILKDATVAMSNATMESSVAVEQISKAIGEVATGVRQQADQARRAAVSLEELTRTANQIAGGANDQARGTQAAVNAVETLQSDINATAELARNLAGSAANSMGETSSGTEAVNRTRVAMERIREESKSAAAAMSTLAERSSAVEAIITTIEEIADQTNLLALNAAIEAARAGDHGRGFAVVADEIRKLAERSSTSTREIATILSAIRAETLQAEKAMQMSSDVTREGLELATTASEALKKLEHAIAETDTVAHDMNSRAGAMRRASEEVAESVGSISAVVQQNAAAAEEMSLTVVAVNETISGVAASAEEQSAASEQVSASAAELAAQVQEISNAASLMRDEGLALGSTVQHFDAGVGQLSNAPRIALTGPA